MSATFCLQRARPCQRRSCRPIGLCRWSGIRPLVGDGSSVREPPKDEADGAHGLLSVGWELSAYRAMAERIVDTVIENHGLTAKPCSTADNPLPGGGRVVNASELEEMGDIQSERLARLYGAEAVDVVTSAARGGLVSAEVEQAVLREGALRLEDYWARRAVEPGLMRARLWVLTSCKRMADLLGWDDSRQVPEIENCRQTDGASQPGFRIDRWEGG